jgi:hypothetical protein
MRHNVFARLVRKVKKDNENGARKSTIEELFYDFNRSRVQIYKMNFVRGIFFGLGSVLGGTVVIALLLWLLSFLVDFPVVGDAIEQAQDTIRSNDR